jgi:ubiquitin-protein ligase
MEEEIMYDEFNIFKQKGIIENYNINILDYKISNPGKFEKISVDLSYVLRSKIIKIKMTIDKELGYSYIDGNNIINFDNLNIEFSKYRYCDMNVDVILNSIINFLNNLNSNELDNEKNLDKYNMFNDSIMKSKYNIDIKLLKKCTSLKDSLININVPKKLLFTQDQIFKMITNEILKINNNFNYDHYIVPVDNNPYELLLYLKFSKGNISKILKELNKNHGYDYIQFKIRIDHKLYPFYPFQLEYCKPKISMKLLFSFMNIDLLNITNWNPTVSLEWFIIELSDKIEKYIPDNIDIKSEDNKNENIAFSNLEYNLIELSSLTKFNPYEKINFNFNVNKLDFNSKKESNNKYWKSGVGYGFSGNSKWNINKFIKDKEEKSLKIGSLLLKILNIIENEKDKNSELLITSTIPKYIIEKLSEANLLEIDKNIELYKNIFKLLDIFSKMSNLPISFINSINKTLKDVNVEINSFINDWNLKDNISKESKDFYLLINCISDWYFSNALFDDNDKKVSTTNINDKYLELVKNNQCCNFELTKKHKYFSEKGRDYNQQSKMNILRQITILKKSLPICWDSSIIFRISKKYFNMISIIIVGPKDTPYHNGLFEFHATFPENFPKDPPNVLIETNGNGKVRFNPNLYEGKGKVCLSLLGTWRGEAGEEWNSKHSTLLQVLISIQSLILVDEPYYNEPGWEKQMNTSEGKRKSFDYKDNIRLQTIKWAINNQIKNSPESYEDFVRNHFILKKNELIKVTNDWVNESKKSKNEMIKERLIMINLLEKLEYKDNTEQANLVKKDIKENKIEISSPTDKHELPLKIIKPEINIGPLKKKIKLSTNFTKEIKKVDNNDNNNDDNDDETTQIINELNL